MKNIKVMVSPHFSDEQFVDSVSGIEFKKDPRGGLRVYGISISEERLSGIHDALRRNILIPADNETRKFINEGKLVEAMNFATREAKPEPAKEEVKEQKEEQAVAEEAPKARVASEPTKKTSRKRNTKKQAAPKVEKQAEETAE